MEYLLICGDSLEKLKDLDENSVDSIVTDPPYELGFMGKKWDKTGIAFKKELWQEALRVLKPGGHLLAFSGTRTVHRMVCAIEDSGFEIRDMITWNYGSGFPKSLDVSKAIDKKFGAEREVIKVNGKVFTGSNNNINGTTGEYDKLSNEPTTPQVKQWQGWGTALKPSIEPICVARKPLSEKTVAENVLKWGVGGLNIDGCRVGASEEDKKIMNDKASKNPTGKKAENVPFVEGICSGANNIGRWPANFIHSGCEEVVSLFPNTKSTVPSDKQKNGGKFPKDNTIKLGLEEIKRTGFDDSGSASRFFYCAKASRKDRNEGLDGFEQKIGGRHAGTSNQETYNNNHHPTVKPTDLMAYLCRLVTPPNGTVLDPFNGSGSTGKACAREGFDYIGIDLSQDYLDISKARIEFERNKKKE